VSQSRSTEGLEGKEREGGTKEMGGPYGASRKWATTNVVARFLLSSSLTQVLTLKPATTGIDEEDEPRQDGWNPTPAYDEMEVAQ
jgi:hypothetical protein